MRSIFYNRFILGLLISMPLSNAFAQTKAKMVLPIAHFYGVSLISANSSETYLASADVKNRVVIWDLHANREIDHVDFKDTILSICFVGENELFIATRNKIIKWSLQDHKQQDLFFINGTNGIKEIKGSELNLFWLLENGDLYNCKPQLSLMKFFEKVDSNILLIDFDMLTRTLHFLKKDYINNIKTKENNISSFYCVKKDSLYILGFQDGVVCKWHTKIDSFERICDFGMKVNKIIRGFKDNQIIACSDNFDVRQFTLSTLENSSVSFSDYCTNMIRLKNCVLVSCYDGSIYFLDSDFRKFGELKSVLKKCTVFEVVDDRTIALGHDDGTILICSKQNKNLLNKIINVEESVNYLTVDSLRHLIFVSTVKKGLFVYSLNDFSQIKHIRFSSDLYSVHLDVTNFKIVVVLSDSIILMDSNYNRCNSIKTNSDMVWFVNAKNNDFYIAELGGVNHVNTRKNIIEFIRPTVPGSDLIYFLECIPFNDGLIYSERNGRIWHNKNDSFLLICDLKNDIHHVFPIESKNKLYIVTQNNMVHEIDVSNYSFDRIFYDSLIPPEHSWNIDRDKTGKFLLSSSNYVYVFFPDWKIFKKIIHNDLICRASDSRKSSLFINNDGDFAAVSYDGSVSWHNYNNLDTAESSDFILTYNKLKFQILFNVQFEKIVYKNFEYQLFFENGINVKFLELRNNDWLAYDEHYRFTGSPGGIEQLYMVCGLEIIDLNQVKDSLYVPDLMSQLMNGAEEIMMNDKPVAKLEDLHICELTPLVEPKESDNPKKLRYEIIPRKGGLGKTELYINGNLTYTYITSNLNPQKNKEGKTVYLLEIDTDSLQTYAIGEKGHKNTIQIKPMIERGAIYGRGSGGYIEKSTDEKSPKFIGVFIGVNDYNNPEKKSNSNYYTNLDYAEKDAVDLSKAIAQSAHSLFQDSVLIYNVTFLNNKPATKNELEAVFADIGNKAKSSDVLYIFFAGHGDIPKVAGNLESEVRFMLHQSTKANPMSTSFGMSELRTWLNPQKIKAQKRVFVFDACHSGQVIEDFNKYAFRGNKDDAWREKQLDKLKDQSGLLIMAAAADNESSYEDPQLQHGVLTYHLLKELKEHAQDTQVIMRQWFDQSKQEVESYVLRKYSSRGTDDAAPIQSPKIFGSGDFALGLSTETLRATIDLASVKTLLGSIKFTDATGSIVAAEPNMVGLIEAEIRKRIDGNKFEFNPKADYGQIGYTIQSGTMVWVGGKSINTYTIRFKGKDMEQVVIPQFAAKKPVDIAIRIAKSIEEKLKTIGDLE